MPHVETTIPSQLELDLRKDEDEIQVKNKIDYLYEEKMDFSEFIDMPTHALPDMSYMFNYIFNPSNTKF